MANTIVIKYGGNASNSKDLKGKILKDIVSLSKNKSVILVHGGLPQINALMKEANLKPKFVNGLRFTDEKTLSIAETALLQVNNTITYGIIEAGGCALGISGRDAGTVIADRREKLGYVGEVKQVKKKLLELLLKEKIIPVIMPICSDGGTGALNVNADEVATQIAIAFRADNLIFLTDVAGVLDSDGKVMSKIKSSQVKSLINKKVISGGMIPKIKGCFNAIRKGVRRVQITDGSKGLLGTSGTVFVR